MEHNINFDYGNEERFNRPKKLLKKKKTTNKSAMRSGAVLVSIKKD